MSLRDISRLSSRLMVMPLAGAVPPAAPGGENSLRKDTDKIPSEGEWASKRTESSDKQPKTSSPHASRQLSVR